MQYFKVKMLVILIFLSCLLIFFLLCPSSNPPPIQTSIHPSFSRMVPSCVVLLNLTSCWTKRLFWCLRGDLALFFPSRSRLSHQNWDWGVGSDEWFYLSPWGQQEELMILYKQGEWFTCCNGAIKGAWGCQRDSVHGAGTQAQWCHISPLELTEVWVSFRLFSKIAVLKIPLTNE